MLKTLAEAKASTLREIAGSCPNSSRFLSLLNEATERLLDCGDWDGTCFPMYVCARAGCVVFPKWVGWIRATNVCNHPATVKNSWWGFIPETMHQTCSPNHLGANMGLIYQGQSPVFSDVAGEGRLIRAYVTVNADIGKTVTIFGIDNYGQQLRHADELGNWVEGIVITTQKPFGSTDIYVRKIDRIIMDDMQVTMRLYAYDATNDALEPIGTYEPGDTNPSFSKYKLSVHGASCDRLVTLISQVKVRYVPARYDNDLVLIQKLPALKDMMQSIKYSEAGDDDAANRYEAKAIRGLNLALWNRDQEGAIPAVVLPFGDTDIGRQHCF